jgi:hypothetical protein
MLNFKTLILPLVFIAQSVLWPGYYCNAASSVEKPIVRCYEGNGGVTVELAVSGPPENESALIRIQGAEPRAWEVVHRASVQRSPESTKFIESINGVNRTVFVVRMHQGFLPIPDQEPYALGESARLERQSSIGTELQRFEAESFAAHHAGTETAQSERVTGSRP